MGLLLEALTSDGTSSRGKLFSAEINALVTSPQFRPHPDFPGVTHGLLEHPKATGAGKHHIRTLAHGGTMLGYTASLSILPDINTGIFIVTNRDSEAGGGPVSFQWKTIEAILDVIHTVERPSAFSVPQIDAKLDLAEYAGEYYFGVFCRTCTQDEFNRGAWQKGAPIKVRVGDGGLSIEDRIYRPIGHHGVFVSVDGLSKVFFGRDKAEIVSFFSFHSSPDTFEKIHEATPNEDIR